MPFSHGAYARGDGQKPEARRRCAAVLTPRVRGRAYAETLRQDAAGGWQETVRAYMRRNMALCGGAFPSRRPGAYARGDGQKPETRWRCAAVLTPHVRGGAYAETLRQAAAGGWQETVRAYMRRNMALCGGAFPSRRPGAHARGICGRRGIRRLRRQRGASERGLKPRQKCHQHPSTSTR